MFVLNMSLPELRLSMLGRIAPAHWIYPTGEDQGKQIPK